MSWLKRIRSSVHKFFLNRKLTGFIYKRETVNLNDANLIGILFNASYPQNISIVNEYASYLRDLGKKTEVLGFFKSSKDKSKKYFPFFTNKELNWYLKPGGKSVSQFIKQDYDLLINATIEECLPLEYLAATSKAKYRIGHYNPYKTSCYDLMISLQSNSSLKYYLEQVDHYLKMIRNGN